ncbi:hypothetical protein M4D58_23780 [Brevibacillus borstelensis]|uniref:hypothetical protein n=1 Tax=Brevibacillus borstelensis TaxID=45462 RepID=UPI00203F578E|nr:hypothetical protein [Brevibacillus borstelensis]MCM3593646.1 hypothetical protein [Brevibacillus borstelensis]
MTKKKQKAIVEALWKDTETVKTFLTQFASNQQLSEEEKEAFQVVDKHLTNVQTWFNGFAEGLR